MSVVTGFAFISIFCHLTPHFPPPDPLPCLSPACMRVAERFSGAMNPFSRPCDYYLFSCKAEMSPKSRGRQQSNTVPYNVITRDLMRRDRDDRLPDRQTALLQAIKEILGMKLTIHRNYKNE